jgi:hypothetical protein
VKNTHKSLKRLVMMMAVTVAGCGGTDSPPSSPVGTWKVSPIPGVAGNDLMPVTAWEVTLVEDSSYRFKFTWAFPANARAFAGCTYAVAESGGTWASVAANGADKLHLTVPQTLTASRAGCADASQNFAERPATANDSLPVVLTTGDYPYRIDGSVLVLMTAQSPISFTRE